jgi:membrane-associated phospholipid phosphatase
MPRALKFKYLLFLAIFNLGTYFIIQNLVTTHQFDFLTELDEAIPLMPNYIWLYHTLLPGIAITMLSLFKTRKAFLTTFWASILATFIINFFYIFLTSFYPREVFEITNMSEALLSATRELDGSNNTFPSGHVAFSWLMYIGITKSKIGNKIQGLKSLYLLWAIGISMSTLVLKQHYIADVICGILLAYVSYYVAGLFINYLSTRPRSNYSEDLSHVQKSCKEQETIDEAL